MSLLKNIIAGQKPSIAGVIRNEQKTETPASESSSSETSEVDSKVHGTQGSQAAKVPSILGALSTRSGGTVSGVAPQQRNVQKQESTTAISPDSEENIAPVVAKKSPILSTLTAVREKAEADKADHDYLFAPIPTDFQELLNRFDDMMCRDQGILDVDLQRCRDFVKRIMIELKENPEYDGLVAARDVHNIIKFQRRTKTQAESAVVVKTEKAAKAAAKPKAKSRFNVDFDAFDLSAKPKSIEDLSNMDISGLDLKL